MTDDEMEACAAQTGPHARSQHQSRTWDRKDFNGRSPSERRPAYTPKPTENASQTDRKLRDYSAIRGGCSKCNSFCHDTLRCPFGSDDNNEKGNGRERQQTQNTGCWTCNGPHLQRRCLLFQQANAVRHDQILIIHKKISGDHKIHVWHLHKMTDIENKTQGFRQCFILHCWRYLLVHL